MIGRPYLRQFAIPAIVAVLSIIAATSDSFAQAPQLEVNVSLSKDTIGLSEQAILEVVVKGSTQDMPEPSLPTLPMFEMYSQGRSTNISIANGQIEAAVTNRYLLVPSRAGTFPISDIAVVYQNKRYVGNTVNLTVLNTGTSATPQLEQKARDGEGASKDYFLDASVDNANPYVNQQIILTLKFYTAVQFYGSPELTEPTTTGFWTELLGTKGPYQQRVNSRTYRVIERKYALFPTATGEQTIGRATITMTVPSRQQSRRPDPFDIFGMLGGGEQAQLTSRPITVKVRPLPEAGRPEDFTGTIGRFVFKATAAKREVEVNQPVSVNFTITGVGNIKSVAEPVIPDLPDFRVYKASSNESISKEDERIGGTKTFEEVFIPKRPGLLEIPAFTFNFFDPETGRYRTLQTDPIALTVSKGEGYTSAPDLPYTAPDVKLGAEARDIRYIKSEPGNLRPPRELLLTSTWYLGVNALPVLALIASVVLRRRREKLSGDIGYARSRRASKEARRRLAQARGLAAVETAEKFFAESSSALLSFVGDKLNVSPHGLTSDRITDLLKEHQADEQLIGDVLAFLDHCAFARYAPSTVSQADIDKALTDAENLMVRLEEVRF